MEYEGEGWEYEDLEPLDSDEETRFCRSVGGGVLGGVAYAKPAFKVLEPVMLSS